MSTLARRPARASSTNTSSSTSPRVTAQVEQGVETREASSDTFLGGVDPDGILFDHESSGASSKTARGQGVPGTGVEASEAMADEDLARVLRSKEHFEQVGAAFGLPPSLLAAIASRETRGGTQLRDDGFSMWDGQGYGIMQVDRRYHAPTGDPRGAAHIRQAAGILAGFRTEMIDRFPSWTAAQQLQGAVYAYNAGPSRVTDWASIDGRSTGGDYSNDVWARARRYAPHFGGEAAPAPDREPAREGAEAALDDFPAYVMRLEAAFESIVSGSMTEAMGAAHAAAEDFRSETGTTGHEHAMSSALGWVWTVADALQKTQTALGAGDHGTAKTQAHLAAERSRSLRGGDWVDPASAERLIQAAGGYWTQADEAARGPSGNGDADLDRQAYTTGRPRPGASVITTPLRGDIDAGDFLPHHADRSNSWAANQIRGGVNQDIDAYDFTFEERDSAGNAINGSALGLPLITPWDAKVLDIQSTYQGSGGLGRFVQLEDVETGYRIAVHHLDTVGDFRVGQILAGGTEFGTQGGSGTSRFGYAVHVDIVGEALPVTEFVRANAGGEFRTREQDLGRGQV